MECLGTITILKVVKTRSLKFPLCLAPQLKKLLRMEFQPYENEPKVRALIRDCAVDKGIPVQWGFNPSSPEVCQNLSLTG